ncbi:MAG: threonine synthase [Candidatus Thorarchaeota archaeon]
MTHLYSTIRCSKCGREYTIDDVPPNDGCGGRIEFLLDVEAAREIVTRESFRRTATGLWRYADLMPIRDGRAVVTLGEGNTPFLRAERLGELMGLRHLYLKNETLNPTGSFKDRPICVGVVRAMQDNAHTVVAASSGNAAASMAAYAARSGLRAVVLVPSTVPSGKLVQLLVLGANVFRVQEKEKGVDPTTQLLWDVNGMDGWAPVPSFGPFNGFQFEGTKTLGYEIAEDMHWQTPDWVLFPTGSGGLMAGTMKGFMEFEQIGLIDEMPRPVVVQPEGCAPVVRAHLDSLTDQIQPWGPTSTICGGLADPMPWDGDAALRYLRRTNGEAVSVSDEEVLRWLVQLARHEGVFAEPSGVATLAGLMQLVNDGVIDSSDTVVVPITGSGFKDLGAAKTQLAEAPIIPPSKDILLRHLGNRRGDK